MCVQGTLTRDIAQRPYKGVRDLTGSRDEGPEKRGVDIRPTTQASEGAKNKIDRIQL